MNNKIYWLWFALKDLSAETSRKLLELYGGVKAVYDDNTYDKEGLRLHKDTLEKLRDKSLDKAEAVTERMDKLGGYILCIDDDEYPPLLRNIYAPPYILYCRGNHLDWKNMLTITIVGTRKYSSYGKRVTEHIAGGLSQSGAAIVSGMALGIDSIAGCKAIKSGGITVAVLGSGIDVVYPSQYAGLYDAICRKGVVISEYPPGTPPYRWNFPRRNRIMAGLSYGVVVTQAPRKSGSLITAAHAIENGRDVFAVPGSIFDMHQEGANALLQMGAKPVMNAGDITEDYPYIKLTPRNTEPKDKPAGIDTSSLSEIEKKIVRLLGGREMHIDELMAEAAGQSQEVGSALIMLEIKGIIHRKSGDRYYI